MKLAWVESTSQRLRLYKMREIKSKMHGPKKYSTKVALDFSLPIVTTSGPLLPHQSGISMPSCMRQSTQCHILSHS